uniref:Uncharacterized protein n=1 Tax=Asparagus officinalis TaxID=4686 RepID=Q2AAB0_ASPOF|nr:hypothetical protein 17.t00003 [Asparagus officinalis]
MVPYTTLEGGFIWVHPNLLVDRQWTSVDSKKSKSRHQGPVEDRAEHGSVQTEKTDRTDPNRPEKIDFMSTGRFSSVVQILVKTKPNRPLHTPSGGKEYLKKYPEAVVAPPRLEEEVTDKAPMSAHDPKGKELCYNKALRKDVLESLKGPFQFDVLAQLGNIPARITLFVLLRLSRSTREAFREALADNETFLDFIPPNPTKKTLEAYPQCHQIFQGRMPCITFSLEDMHVSKPKHDRPLYFIGYISFIRVDRIQVGPGSSLSIIPLRLIRYLGGSTTSVVDNGNHHLWLQCFKHSSSRQNQTQIHNNLIVPSTLHQCIKYVDKSGEVRTVIAEKQPFKGVENYFTDSIHYLNGEPIDVPLVEDLDSGNEADTESDYEHGLIFNNIEPIIIDLESSSANGISDLLPRLYVESALHMLIQSSLVASRRQIESSQAVFIVPAKNNGQKDIIFGRTDGPIQTLQEESQK